MMGSGSEGGVTMSQVNQHSVSIADPAEHSAALEIQWIVHGTWPIAAAFAGSKVEQSCPQTDRASERR